MAGCELHTLLEGGAFFEGPRRHDGRTLLLCAAPDSGASREGATDAVLLTTTVDVPHAGLP